MSNERIAALRTKLEEAERLRYRAVCKVRCLESSLDRIDIDRFDEVMEMLENAKVESRKLGLRCFDLRYELQCAEYEARRNG